MKLIILYINDGHTLGDTLLESNLAKALSLKHIYSMTLKEIMWDGGGKPLCIEDSLQSDLKHKVEN